MKEFSKYVGLDVHKESRSATGTTIAADGGRSSYIKVQPLE